MGCSLESFLAAVSYHTSTVVSRHAGAIWNKKQSMKLTQTSEHGDKQTVLGCVNSIVK